MHVRNKGKKRFLTEFTPLESRVMWLIPGLCSHCIKMKICYSRTFRTFLSEASIFLKNEFPIIFIGLAAFMNSAPDSIWTVWEKGRLPHIPEDWPSKFAGVRQRAISLTTGSNSSHQLGGSIESNPCFYGQE